MNQSNIEGTECGLYEKSSGRKIESPLDMNSVEFLEKILSLTSRLFFTIIRAGGVNKIHPGHRKHLICKAKSLCDEIKLSLR